jgi:hypothetical protein
MLKKLAGWCKRWDWMRLQLKINTAIAETWKAVFQQRLGRIG